MSDVYLVNPPCARLSFTEGVAVTYMPLGLAYLAASLEKAGFATTALDADILGYSEPQIADTILKEKPRVVGLSVMSTTLRSCYFIASSLKAAKFPGEIILGGPHVTALPETVKDMDLTYGVIGDGEQSFTRLCKAIIDGTYDAGEIQGVYNASKGKKIKPFCNKNLDDIPTPARALFPVERYSHLSFITSRGCPMKCAFCLMPNTAYQSRSPEKVVAEIEDAVGEHGIQRISFVDDNFTLERERTLDILNLISEKNLNISFNCQSRPDILDEELARALKEAGCHLIFFGVESGSEDIRASIGKNISDDQFIEAFKLCRKEGILTRAYFMLGFLGETERQIEETLDFPKKILPDAVDYCVTEIYPGTKLAEDLLAEGVIEPDVWTRFMRGEKDYPLYIPEGYTKQKLTGLTVEGYRRFYFSRRYLARKWMNIKSIPDFHEALAHTVYTIKAHTQPIPKPLN